ncbi:AMP-binding protein [Anaerolineales bacterium]
MADFNQRIQDLVNYAYQHAPAIQDIMKQNNLTPADIQSTDDLSKIPVLSKDELVEIHRNNPPFGGFLTVDPADLPRIYISPGPIYDPQPIQENPEASLAPFKYVGFGRGDRVLNTFMYHLTPAGILLDDGIRACGATVIPSGPGNTDLQIMMTMALGVTGFVGQPSYLMQILDKMEEMGIDATQNPIKKALFSAEPYMPSQRSRFEETYGMKTTSAYGTADLGFLGYTKAGVEGFCLLDTVYVQIVDPETGQDVELGHIGEIVVTTFNKSYPLIRFGTGDLGALAAEPACEGQQLTGLFGRSGDAIKVRGMFLHPNQLLAASTYLPEIKKIQAIITRPENKDFVTIRIATQDGSEDLALAEKLKGLAQNAVRLRIDEVLFAKEDDISGRTIIDERKWD